MAETEKVKTKKEQCAEALFNIPTNYMSSGMIKWILSHLPDENKKGEFSASASIASAPGPELKFITEKGAQGLHGAFNLTFEDLTNLKNKVTDAFGDTEKDGVPRVEIMEKVYPQLCDAEKAFLIALGIEPFGPYWSHFDMQSKGGVPKSLDDLLDILKKMRDKLKDRMDETEEGGEDE